MSQSPSENEPLLVVNGGDEEAAPNYAVTSQRRTLKDWFVVITLVVLCAITITFIAVKKPTEDSSLLHDIRKLYNTPSLAAGALRKGILTTQVTGFRKYGDSTLVRTDDIWHLGSNTKAITATVLALLIEDGLLTWETTIAEALPAWKNKMLDEHGNTTLAMLGAHRGGLSDAWSTLSDLESTDFFTGLYNYSSMEGRGLIAEYALTHSPIFTPGSKFLYSNTGYVMLGFVMEQITSESWEDLIEKRVFKPLGMKECSVGSRDTSIPPTNPWPHLLVNSSDIIPLVPDIYWDNPLAIGPAGTVSCSLDSYSKFLEFHLDGYHGRRATGNISLSDISFKRLHDPWPGNRYSCGGWGVLDIEGTGHVLTHSGSNNLNYLEAMIVPDMESAFVAATNIGSAENATDAVIKALIDGRLLSK